MIATGGISKLRSVLFTLTSGLSGTFSLNVFEFIWNVKF